MTLYYKLVNGEAQAYRFHHVPKEACHTLRKYDPKSRKGDMLTVFSHIVSIIGALLTAISNLLCLFKLLRTKSMNVYDQIQAFAVTVIRII